MKIPKNIRYLRLLITLQKFRFCLEGSSKRPPIIEHVPTHTNIYLQKICTLAENYITRAKEFVCFPRFKNWISTISHRVGEAVSDGTKTKLNKIIRVAGKN